MLTEIKASQLLDTEFKTDLKINELSVYYQNYRETIRNLLQKNIFMKKDIDTISKDQEERNSTISE